MKTVRQYFNRSLIIPILMGVLLINTLVFATAPTGGYSPGATLDPDCVPGSSADCVVTLYSFSNGLTKTSNTVKLGGSLTANTDIALSTRTFSLSGASGTFDVNTGTVTINSAGTTTVNGVNYVSLGIGGVAALSIGGSGGGVRDIQFNNYPNSRTDATTPVNFLYTDTTGNVLSKPIGSLVSNNLGLTAGSVAFVNPTGGLTQDNANFFWNDTTNRLGLGTASPTQALDVVGAVKFSGALIPAGNGGAGINGNIYTILTGDGSTAPAWTTLNFVSIADAQILAQKGAASGIAPLNSSSKIDSSYIPAVALNAVWVGPYTQLTGGSLGTNCTDISTTAIGDICITTPGDSYILKATSSSTSTNWVLMNPAAASVISLNSKANAVTLQGGNGLAVTSGGAQIINVDLGGTLSDDTEIDSNGKYFSLTGTSLFGIGMTASFAPTEALDVVGNIQMTGAFMPSGSAGTAGQLLQSNGSGSAPTWISNPMASGTSTGQIKYWNGSAWTDLNIGTNNQVLAVSGGGVPNWVNNSTGITSMNGLSVATQTFGAGTSGSDFNISSSGSAHTFNFPDASMTNRGLLTPIDYNRLDTAYVLVTTSALHNGGDAYGLPLSVGTNDDFNFLIKANGQTAGQFFTSTSTNSDSVALGIGAGQGAGPTPALINSIFLAPYAGNGAATVSSSNFIGVSAGSGAANISNSVFISTNAGVNSDDIIGTVILGNGAGGGANTVDDSLFLGSGTGTGATSTSDSIFIGTDAGSSTNNASNSIFIGHAAGNNDTVSNTAGHTSILIGESTSTGGFSDSIALGQGAINTASNEFMIGGGGANSGIDILILNGTAGNTCTMDVTVAAPSCTSDERLKHNITDLSDGTLDKILQVRTVNYVWNNFPDAGIQTGFIAQDLEQYFPEFVSVAPNGYKTVSYGAMTSPIVKAIQEMNLNITDISNIEKTNTWRDALISWLGNIANGITEIFAKKIHAGEQICINTTCIDENQLQNILQNMTTTTPVVVSPVNPDPVEPDPVDTTGGDTPVVETPVEPVVPPVLDNPVNNESTTTEL